MKTIVISDIHGCYEELKDLLFFLEEEGEYNKDTDKLIFLGDYVDRGKDSRLVVKFVRELQENNPNVIALMGNHEDMMIDHYRGFDSWWRFNGGDKTIKSYAGFNNQLRSDIKWMENLPLYYEDENFIYVHAGVDVNKPLEQQDRQTLLWIREPFIWAEKKYHKQVIFGHTPTVTLNGGSKPIYTITNNVGIDTGCVFGGALTALIIDDGEIKSLFQVSSEIEEENENEEYEKTNM